MKRVVAITIIYCFCVFLFSAFLVFFQTEIPELLPNSEFSYKIKLSLLQFCSLLPCVLISAFVIGYTFMFNSLDKPILVRFSPTMMKFFRKILVAALCGSAFLTITYEVAMPLLRQSLKYMEEAPSLYSQYIKSAERYFNDKSYTVSYQYAKAAENLYPNSPEAAILIDKCEVSFDHLLETAVPDVKIDIPALPQEEILMMNNATSYQLLQRAKNCFDSENWIDAHYYSMLAISAAETGSANELDAKFLAAEAWNQLEQIGVYQDSEVETLYKPKMKAYEMLVDGDIVSAYYAFGDLAKQYPKDRDIERFYSIASYEMQQNYFFFDELPESGMLEDDSNIYFYVTRPNGSFYVVYIKGTATVKDTGGMVQLLRDVSVYQYTRNGNFEMSFYVPYAKMLALPVTSLDEKTKEQIGNLDSIDSVPMMMLESADRIQNQEICRPDFTFSSEVISSGRNNSFSFLILPMAYEDFLLLKNVSNDPDEMTLSDLFLFTRKTVNYGYPKETYLQALCYRINLPILYVAILILAAGIGWNYRLLPGSRFRLTWAFILPFLSVMLYAFLNMLHYIQKLLNYSMISLLGTAVLPISIGVSICLFIFSILTFVSRKS